MGKINFIFNMLSLRYLRSVGVAMSHRLLEIQVWHPDDQLELEIHI